MNFYFRIGKNTIIFFVLQLLKTLESSESLRIKTAGQYLVKSVPYVCGGKNNQCPEWWGCPLSNETYSLLLFNITWLTKLEHFAVSLQALVPFC